MLSKFSVKKPVTITMIVFIILLLGAVSLGKLSIDLMPSIEMPIAIVQTSYSDAGPEEIENLITKPLEEVLVTVENIDTISSISNNGSSIIIMQFNFNTDMNFTTLEIREKIDLIKNYLPDGATSPMVMKMNMDSLPIVQIAISSKGDIYTTQKVAEDVIKPRIERIEGAASADIGGGLEREVQIVLKDELLKGYNLSSDRISQILQAENLNLPGGSVSKGNSDLTVRTVGEFKSVEEIRDINIPLPTGGTIRLRDIADVNLVDKDQNSIAKLNGQSVIQMSVMKQSDGNTVNVSRKVNEELEKIRKEYPDLNIVTVMDQAEYINLAINNLVNSGFVGIILAVIILLLFLRSFKTTSIIAVSIPISVITTFILLYFSGITLNMMTIGGLSLGIGMLVDNSIVVLENIHRHRSLGMDRINASVTGTNEVSMAVTASTLTTIAVFIPIVFSGGLAATIFKDFALTIVVSLVSSLGVALTLVPMMSSKLITVKHIVTEEEQENTHNVFIRSYKKILEWCLKHRLSTIASSIVLFAVSLAMLGTVGAEFFPTTDQGQINVNVSLPSGAKLSDTERILEQVQMEVSKIPEVKIVFTTSGGGGAMSMGGQTGNSGSITVMLSSLEERQRSVKQVGDDIRKIVKDIPGAKISVSEASMMSMTSGGEISISIKGDDSEILKKISDDFKGIIETVDGAREVKTGFTEGNPEVQIIVDRAIASQYGLTSAQVGSAVRSTLSGATVTKFKYEGNELDVRLKGDSIYKESLSLLEMIPIPTPSGGNVHLSEVADIKIEKNPTSIERQNQSRVITVSGSVTGRDVQSVSKDIVNLLDKYDMPKGYSYSMGGETQQIEETFGDLFMALGLAVILVYMILAAQFESMIQPLSILFTIPLALSGSFIMLFVTRTPLSVTGIIGLIMLVGIVVNNGIVLIDYINSRRAMGENRTDAILKAGPIRIRPILMTALTTILGMIPMSLGIGEGAELTQALGLVVIGGLSLSTLLTLLFVPVVYSVFDDITGFFKRKLKLNKDDNIKTIEQ